LSAIATDDVDERGHVERMETARRYAHLINAGEEVRSIDMRRRTVGQGQEGRTATRQHNDTDKNDVSNRRYTKKDRLLDMIYYEIFNCKTCYDIV
jgi:hypothetical protein